MTVTNTKFDKIAHENKERDKKLADERKKANEKLTKDWHLKKGK